MRCAVPTCRREIPKGETVWHEVIGYEKERAQGGTNALKFRQRTGTVICDHCRLRREHGGSTGQGELFDKGT